MVRDSALFNRIKKTIQNIDDELRRSNNTGVYFAPELYTAFCLGRDIFQNRAAIFDLPDLIWLRETTLNNGGPSDIVFKLGNRHVVIELKLRDTGDAYGADINKLKLLSATDEKYFCVLLDSFTDQNDERLLNLEQQNQGHLRKIGHYSFPTWNNWYKNQIYCNLNLYKIT